MRAVITIQSRSSIEQQRSHLLRHQPPEDRSAAVQREPLTRRFLAKQAALAVRETIGHVSSHASRRGRRYLLRDHVLVDDLEPVVAEPGEGYRNPP